MGKYIYYGHEDYQTIGLYSRNFETTNYCSYLATRYHYGNNNTLIYPVDNEYIGQYGDFYIKIDEHPEALDTAKKLYIHPDCSISREAVRRKYKKVLNIASADAVIVPTGCAVEETASNSAVFVNDDRKILVFVTFYRTDEEDQAVYKTMSGSFMGTPLEKFIPQKNMYLFEGKDSIKEAKLVHTGPLVFFKGKGSYVLDYMTYMLPKEKIVFEDTLMKSLGDETNVPTYDSMVSIYEMLVSNDEATRDLGLKSLAAMDYANYPKSTTLILKHTAWNYCNARNTTAVKYMLKELGIKNTSYSRYIPYKDRMISEKDYALFEQLVRKLEKLNSDIDYVHFCYDIPFVYIDNNFKVHPRTA